MGSVAHIWWPGVDQWTKRVGVRHWGSELRKRGATVRRRNLVVLTLGFADWFSVRGMSPLSDERIEEQD